MAVKNRVGHGKCQTLDIFRRFVQLFPQGFDRFDSRVKPFVKPLNY
nr:MAG TPA: hypothetical protein [Caudoviricetes sp.]